MNGRDDSINGASARGVNIFKVQGFRSAQALSNHWMRHGSEYELDGITTKEQYQDRALELVQSAVGGYIFGHVDKEGYVVRYDSSTNDFVKGNPILGVWTLFKPKYSGYYALMRREDLEHGGKA